MHWVVLTTFIGPQVLVNLTHVVAIEPNLSGGGSRLRTVLLDDKGKPVTFTVREDPAKILKAATQKSN